MRRVGLRIDVDTLRGTCYGVPKLIDLLAQYQIRASFFFSVGPDNMGRHLWRLIRPRFLIKMLRTRAGRLYGWDILLRGTLWPGPTIGIKCAKAILAAAQHGHEIGLHAWDHYRWQRRISHMHPNAIRDEIQKGYDMLATITGQQACGFAAPAWRVTSQALDILDQFPFQYQSDCRGHSLFRPKIGNRIYKHIQIPTTLPTYDEVIGRACTHHNYNEYMFRQIRADGLNVLTIHAEVEGISGLDMFRDFLDKARQLNIVFEPLANLLTANPDVTESGIYHCNVPGRDGWLACQESVVRSYQHHRI